MDYSKLPKLSGDGQGAQPAAKPEEDIPTARQAKADHVYRPAPEPFNAGQAWLNIAIGLILLIMMPNLLKYLFGGTMPLYTDEKGAPMRYIDTVFFRGDLAITAFAVVLILEGLLIAYTRNAMVILVVLLFTLLATIGNLLYVIDMMRRGYSLQLMSALAVVFGVYIAMYEWRLYQGSKR